MNWGELERVSVDSLFIYFFLGGGVLMGPPTPPRYQSIHYYVYDMEFQMTFCLKNMI